MIGFIFIEDTPTKVQGSFRHRKVLGSIPCL